MIPEMGVFALCIATVLCLLVTLGLAGELIRGKAFSLMEATIRPLTLIVFLTISLAFGGLILAYVESDFSVANVVANSHTLKPMLYKVTGAWSNHEGSLLLWLWVMGLIAFAIAAKDFGRQSRLQHASLAVQLFLMLGFLCFLLFTSNPFERIFPPAVEGDDMNPLLQDFGLAVHPPFLYLGYVGFSGIFSLAVGGMLAKEEGKRWAALVRSFVLAPWCLLTLGIGMGGWWAYRELGWGGWWFWDPVENVSLLPWLLGTALLHSIVVLEKRGALLIWTKLLSLLTFTFCMVGTFLVRSGLLTSVHSFASDPTRGIYLLSFIAIVLTAGFTLFAWRAMTLEPAPTVRPLSREGVLVWNNLLFTVATLTVMFATLYPLLLEATTGQGVSIGVDYFNATFFPLIVPLLLLMAISPLMVWKRNDTATLWRAGKVCLLAGAIFCLLLWLFLRPLPLLAIAGFLLVGWMVAGIVLKLLRLLGYGRKGEGVARIRQISGREWGMLLAHLGAAMLLAGIIGTGLMKIEVEQELKPGEKLALGSHTNLLLETIETREGPNFNALIARMEILRYGAESGTLYPQLRNYKTREMQTSESSIRPHPLYDVYAVLGKVAPDGEHFIVRAYYKPLISFVWGGFIFMALGGLLAMKPKRRLITEPSTVRDQHAGTVV
jgi:cytochrome c-type biogenesis protein CcmF